MWGQLEPTPRVGCATRYASMAKFRAEVGNVERSPTSVVGWEGVRPIMRNDRPPSDATIYAGSPSLTDLSALMPSAIVYARRPHPHPQRCQNHHIPESATVHACTTTGSDHRKHPSRLSMRGQHT